MEETAPRHRISAKQTAKNYWQIDATVEINNDTTSGTALAKDLLGLVKSTEEVFRADGKKIVGDE